MSSSNSYNFTTTRDLLITDAHLHIGAIGEGESPSTNQITEAARLLNMIVKLRAADGMPLWALKRGYLLPVTGVSSVNTTSHIVTAYDQTTLGAAEAASQTILTVTSSASMTAADEVGIELDDGSMQWTTIVSVDDSTTITITTALTSAAASGNKVYSYTASSDRIYRPLRVIDANVLQTTDSTSWSIDLISSSDYYGLGNRTSTSTPNSLYYDAGLGSGAADPTSSTTWYGTFYIYPRFSDGDHIIEFTYQRPFQDFDAASDHPDFPQEFYLPIVLELGALLAPKFGVPLDEQKNLLALSKIYREEALTTIQPEGSIYFSREDQ